ncbi:ABC transporter [Bifidobacterium lemurum]|uniref:ABC transporter n=1 Tax=Bifidobacterium lemurum TaxID=1603886 RepID=A0A261FUC5_9BIFI|nr:ABC transporter ATP-binding protein [Bifidobacterium lemurum]OZG62728.1 ABC transporter [Bifidobacterium lemurum]
MTASIAQPSSSRPPAIEIDHLTKRYGAARGIDDVSFTVYPGEIFGFIGPNGAGKSTTIRTLLGLIRKTSGQARVLGLDIERDHVDIMHHVGYLPSEVFYYDGMRAKDLLAYAASFHPERDCAGRIRELAERLDLDLNRRIEDMSLGNRKKVGIIQGLLHSPEVIMLDEPTSGLDPLMQRTFFDVIREEADRGATILFSSHILSEVQRICDRVAIIKDGRIIAVRAIEEMRRASVKQVRLMMPSPNGSSVSSDIGRLAALPGVRSFEILESRGDASTPTGTGQSDIRRSAPQQAAMATFLFEGEANRLIGHLASFDLADVEITEPTLEEVFMHYYTDERSACEPGEAAR